jgi:hypothetical protein
LTLFVDTAANGDLLSLDPERGGDRFRSLALHRPHGATVAT